LVGRCWIFWEFIHLSGKFERGICHVGKEKCAQSQRGLLQFTLQAHVDQGRFGSVQGTFDSVRGTSSSIQGMFGSVQGMFGSVRGMFGMANIQQGFGERSAVFSSVQ
jgi:hypothetical protein